SDLDVSDDAAISRLFDDLKQSYGKLHVLVHSVAFAPAEELRGEFINTTREGFRMAHDISVYSLIALSRAAAPLMADGGSIMTMTYYGAEKVVPKYNVMAVAEAAVGCHRRYAAHQLRSKKDSSQRHFSRADQNPCRPWNCWTGRDAEIPC